VEPKFANLLNYTVNATEVIFDFGAFFPRPQLGVQTPTDSDYHTRIVMGADVLDALLAALPELKKMRDQAREQQRKPNPATDMKGGTQ
jgi:hypothetical protein